MSETKAVYAVSVPVADVVESVVIQGDLSKLTAEQRVNYYQRVCASLGLNPLTKPFDYITLNGKLTLYARRDAADQLRKRDAISIGSLTTQVINDVYIVTGVFETLDGRKDMATGAVNIKGLAGDSLANAMMKAETKCKRRGTLSICGLGFLDETEVETIPDAQPVAAESEPHWIDDPKVRAGFFAWLKEKGLSHEEVKQLLQIKHIHDFQGTRDEFKEAVMAAIGKRCADKAVQQDVADLYGEAVPA